MGHVEALARASMRIPALSFKMAPAVTNRIVLVVKLHNGRPWFAGHDNLHFAVLSLSDKAFERCHLLEYLGQIIFRVPSAARSLPTHLAIRTATFRSKTLIDAGMMAAFCAC
jgi:hypothetical protein